MTANRGINGTWWVDDIDTYKKALTEALAEGRLSVDYQPRFSLGTGRLAGVEGLARWTHAAGRLTAVEFVGAAEVGRVVGALDAFVVSAACTQLAEWESAVPLPPGFYLVVNISVQDLDDTGFADTARSALERSGANPSHLRLEVTCSSAGGNGAESLKVIAELRDLGVGVDVDAFERFTSLATLQRFRPGRIGVSLRYAKDRPSPETDAMYGAMARLCGSMGAVGVAKAIDSDEILDWMKGLGYDEGQGFHLGAPGPAADIVAFLRADQ